MSPPLRVVIADDHPFYRMGIARWLRASGLDVVGEASSGEAALRAVEETAPDVVVMDLKMPGMSGIEATRRLVERAPASRVVVLSVSAEDADVTEAILAGASSYLLKDRPVDELVEAIRAVVSGGPRISPQVALPLLRRLGEAASADPELAGLRFAPDEAELLERLADDEPDHRVAAALGIDLVSLHERASAVLARLHADGRLRPLLRAAQPRPH